jgi:cleavage stimulation factor subunit 2
MSKTVFVGNLAYELTEESLTTVMREAGPVVDAHITIDKVTGRSLGVGFVDYFNADTALLAARNLNGREIFGRAMRVEVHTIPKKRARPEEEEEDTPPPKKARISTEDVDPFLAAATTLSHFIRERKPKATILACLHILQTLIGDIKD